MKLRPLLILAAAAAIGVGAWLVLRPAGRARKVVLISVDTLRADHLGCYGGKKPVSPNLDALAADGALFRHAVSAVPITLPSHSTMLTGTNPPFHGVHDATGFKLPDSSLTLAEALKERGWRTGAVVAAFVLDSQFGLDQGFDSYDDGGLTVEEPERSCERVTRIASAWLDAHAREDFFLFVHYYDPHLGYDPPEPFRSQLAGDPYSGEIAYTDHCIGQLVEKLKALGIYSSTLVIATADHGEGLGEHTEVGHGYFIYDSTLRVPLIVKPPGKSGGGRVVEDLAGLVDVMPTVLDAAGVPAPASAAAPMHGRSLYALARGEAPGAGGSAGAGEERALYAESLLPTKFGCSPLLGLVRPSWKYIQAPRPELYDLAKDPGETHDLAGEFPGRTKELGAELLKVVSEQARPDPQAGAPPDEETIARLESLGYVAGLGVNTSLAFDSKSEDPKDFAPVYNAFMRARERFATGDFRLARAECEAIAAARPGFDEVFNLLGKIDLAQGRTDEAIAHFSRYLELLDPPGSGLPPKPQGAEVRETLANLLDRRRDAAGALVQLTALLELRPDDASVHARVASILGWHGHREKALHHWREAARLDPGNADTRNKLAEELVIAGDIEGAAREWTETIRLAPGQLMARLNLGAALLRLHRPAEAQPHLDEVVKAKPSLAKGQRLLAESYYRQGKVKEALQHWEQALRHDPADIATLESYAWALATSEDASVRNPEKALPLAEQARKAAANRPDVLRTFAAALAASGRFPEAVKAADQAVALFTQAGLPEDAAAARAQRVLYAAGKPYLEPAKSSG